MKEKFKSLDAKKVVIAVGSGVCVGALIASAYLKGYGDGLYDAAYATGVRLFHLCQKHPDCDLATEIGELIETDNFYSEALFPKRFLIRK